MTQAAQIVEYLKRFHTITRAECMSRLGIMEITPRLVELEALGFVFNRDRVRHINGQGKSVQICLYSIAKYPKGWKR